MEWLFCFSSVHLMLGCPLFKRFKKFNLVRCQKQLECHQHILNKNLGLLGLYSYSHLDS